MKKLFLALLLAVGVQLAAPPVSSADNIFHREEPKGAHDKNKRGSTKGKHQAANARRAREQAAAAQRHHEASKASTRRKQAAKQAKAMAKKQGRRGGRQ
jgi:hypothetical protein